MTPTAIRSSGLATGELDPFLNIKIAQLDKLVEQHYPTYFVQVQAQIKKCVEYVLTLFTNHETRGLILKAIEFAVLEQHHLFQKDDSPIIMHELEAACLLASASQVRDADLFIATILHHGQFDRQKDVDGNFFTQVELECVERHISRRARKILEEFDSLPQFNTPETREAVIRGAPNLSPTVQNLWLVDRLAHPAFTQESHIATSRLLDAMTSADQTLKETCRIKLSFT